MIYAETIVKFRGQEHKAVSSTVGEHTYVSVVGISPNANKKSRAIDRAAKQMHVKGKWDVVPHVKHLQDAKYWLTLPCVAIRGIDGMLALGLNSSGDPVIFNSIEKTIKCHGIQELPSVMKDLDWTSHESTTFELAQGVVELAEQYLKRGGFADNPDAMVEARNDLVTLVDIAGLSNKIDVLYDSANSYITVKAPGIASFDYPEQDGETQHSQLEAFHQPSAETAVVEMQVEHLEGTEEDLDSAINTNVESRPASNSLLMGYDKQRPLGNDKQRPRHPLDQARHNYRPRPGGVNDLPVSENPLRMDEYEPIVFELPGNGPVILNDTSHLIQVEGMQVRQVNLRDYHGSSHYEGRHVAAIIVDFTNPATGLEQYKYIREFNHHVGILMLFKQGTQYVLEAERLPKERNDDL